MTRNPIERDLSHHFQEALGELTLRHVRIAQGVLPAAEVSMMLIQAATAMMLTAAATTAASCESGDAGEMFDFVVAGIARFAAADRERALAEAAAKRCAA